MKHFILALVLLLANTAARSGSPDGLHLLIVSNDNASAYASVVQDYFNRYRPGYKGFSCEDAQLNIASVYQKSHPAGIDADQVRLAIKTVPAHKKLARLLQRYRDKQNDCGFDGVLYYEVKEQYLDIRGISAGDHSDIYLSKIPLAKTNDEKAINAAMCKAIINLPILKEP